MERHTDTPIYQAFRGDATLYFHLLSGLILPLKKL